MKMQFVLAAIASFGLTLGAAAAGAKAYQITGPVVEITDAKIVIEHKTGEKWEINRTADTKGAAVKVGDKVTVKYTMTATSIEEKAAEAKSEKKPEAKPEKKPEAKTEKKPEAKPEKKPAKK